MGALPTGTVSFLFTDVVGSTRRWQEQPDAMAAALAVHDGILRNAIAGHRGYVFSTAGDSFAAAFSGVSDAVDAAVAAQRGLSTAEWPEDLRLGVRMGVHTGEAVERGGDYFGPTLNLAARTMSVAHGGQILATESAARLLEGAKDGTLFVDLGAQSLRDIERDIVVFQIVADGLPSEFPPLATSDTSRVSLPSARSSFIGRTDEISRARRALHDHHLVTLTGVGGCGKTRLAVEVASRVANRFSDGVKFVDLARVGDDAGVAEAIAVSIGFVPRSAGPVGQQVRRRLGTGTHLLLFDNCEHVIDEVVDHVDALLAECPNVRVLATSREPLGVDGEGILRVPPLDLDGGDGRSAAEMLFVARMVDLGVTTSDQHDAGLDDEAISAVCRRLDGLPLAIELAAARTPVMSPVQILQRLDDRFSLLTGGRRRTRGRHQTLEATIGWSYDLLEGDERDALRRLSVMPAVFDIEMAAAVLDRSQGATLDLLEGLVSRSLLQTVRDDQSAAQFRLLETVRSYAYERLAEHGDAEATRDRHADHVVQRLDELGFSFRSMRPEQSAIADDVLAAIDWARARENRALAADLLAGGLGVPVARGAYRWALDIAAWATTADDPLVRSRAHLARGFLAMVADSDDTHPARCSDAALQAAGDQWVSWRATAHFLGMLYAVFGFPEAFAEHARLARAAIVSGECSLDTEANLAWIENVGNLWRNKNAELPALSLLEPDGARDEITLVNLHGVRLLTPLFATDVTEIEGELFNPTAVAARRRFLGVAMRGEQWTLSYEAIRGAAAATLGRIDEARHDLAAALRRVGPERMPGIDEDFLGAFAWACIAAGEHARAAELLDDTWVVARSPTTLMMIVVAQERALGLPVDPERRTSELFRRSQLRDVIRNEDRARHALDSELGRLGLHDGIMAASMRGRPTAQPQLDPDR